MLVEIQYDARIDSGPILALPCIAFLHLVVKKSPTFLVINLCVSRINATQGLASLGTFLYAAALYHLCPCFNGSSPEPDPSIATLDVESLDPLSAC